MINTIQKVTPEKYIVKFANKSRDSKYLKKLKLHLNRDKEDTKF